MFWYALIYTNIFLFLLLLIAFYIFIFYTSTYAGISEEIVWSKNDMLRLNLIHPIIMIFTACTMVYVKGQDVGLWHAIACQVFGYQVSSGIYFSSILYYATVNGPDDKYYSIFHSASRLNIDKIIPGYLFFFFLTFCISLNYKIFLALAVNHFNFIFWKFKHYKYLIAVP